jgi:cytoskeletal protein RodZ
VESNVDINSENIFDEFTDSQDIKTELEKNDKNNEKDVYYYMKKISSFLLSINIVLFLLVISCF